MSSDHESRRQIRMERHISQIKTMLMIILNLIIFEWYHPSTVVGIMLIAFTSLYALWNLFGRELSNHRNGISEQQTGRRLEQALSKSPESSIDVD